jgi:hypothetical protein
MFKRDIFQPADSENDLNQKLFIHINYNVGCRQVYVFAYHLYTRTTYYKLNNLNDHVNEPING